jgi:ornithine cyclodeaminase/alanine dehydrogenase-like protein (mu-crystallin family)
LITEEEHMNTLYLKEEDVAQLVTVPEVIDILDTVFRDQAAGRAWNNSRNRLRLPGATMHMMAGAIPGYFGYKAYTVTAGKTNFLFFLYSAKTTDLLAIIEADALGQKRTGAASGLATRLLSKPDSRNAMFFGAGWQAQSQLLAIDAVRDLKQVSIVTRKPESRDAFIKKMQPLVKATLVASSSAEEAVRSSDIVVTITSSREPVLKGEWLRPGVHINAAGGNLLLRREIDDDVVMKSTRLVVDSLDQCKIESGEFLGVIESGRRHWEDFVELRDVVAGLKPGRTSPADITLFKSGGVAIEDVAIGKVVYERALERKAGKPLKL